MKADENDLAETAGGSQVETAGGSQVETVGDSTVGDSEEREMRLYIKNEYTIEKECQNMEIFVEEIF
jgi:hypothetical protein